MGQSVKNGKHCFGRQRVKLQYSQRHNGMHAMSCSGLSYSINMLENRGKYLEYTLTTENMIYIYGIYIYTTVAIEKPQINSCTLHKHFHCMKNKHTQVALIKNKERKKVFTLTKYTC
jgi:hypothetical protein